jgi:hypothetical protein
LKLRFFVAPKGLNMSAQGNALEIVEDSSI